MQGLMDDANEEACQGACQWVNMYCSGTRQHISYTCVRGRVEYWANLKPQRLGPVLSVVGVDPGGVLVHALAVHGRGLGPPMVAQGARQGVANRAWDVSQLTAKSLQGCHFCW